MVESASNSYHVEMMSKTGQVACQEGLQTI
jgi:hypothetical protein